MASTTLASVAAATAAGYVLQRVDLGVLVATSPTAQTKNRFRTTFIKRGLGNNNNTLRADGESSASSGAADTAALAALNAQRQARYGFDTTALNINPATGAAYTAADI
jgi:hypothetical protein